MEYFIITGTSRGIGAALASSLLEKGATVIGISRSAPSEGDIRHIKADLSDIEAVETVMRRALSEVDPSTATSLTLINNAGVLDPIAKIEACSPADLDFHLKVNLTAPAALTGSFIRGSADWPVPRRVVNITSGAAKTPYPGWSAYCSAKAGIDMLTQVVATEQNGESNPVRTIAIAPGVVETTMQETIRATNEERFPKVEKFRELKESGALSAPREAAERVIGILRDETVESGSIVDVRAYYG